MKSGNDNNNQSLHNAPSKVTILPILGKPRIIAANTLDLIDRKSSSTSTDTHQHDLKSESRITSGLSSSSLAMDGSFSKNPSSSNPQNPSLSMPIKNLDKVSAKSIAGFVAKLYKMLNESTSNLIKWSEDGTSFIVYKPEDFSRQLLPRFFKHNNFSSFVRQLNMYDFHKVPHIQQGSIMNNLNMEQDSIWEFSHSFFLRNRPDLLANVKRKINTFIDENSGNNDKGLGIGGSRISNNHNRNAISRYGNNLINNNIDEKRLDKRIGSLSRSVMIPKNAALSNQSNLIQVLSELEALRSQQSAIQTDISTLQRDNQLLWNETMASRERHIHQQQVIFKIFKFLASIFSGEGVSGVGGVGSGRTGNISSSSTNGMGNLGSTTFNASNSTPFSNPSKRQLMMIGDGMAYPELQESMKELLFPSSTPSPPPNQNNVDSDYRNYQFPSSNSHVKMDNRDRIADILNTSHGIENDLDFWQGQMDSGNLGDISQFLKEGTLPLNDGDNDNSLDIMTLSSLSGKSSSSTRSNMPQIPSLEDLLDLPTSMSSNEIADGQIESTFALTPSSINSIATRSMPSISSPEKRIKLMANNERMKEIENVNLEASNSFESTEKNNDEIDDIDIDDKSASASQSIIDSSNENNNNLDLTKYLERYE